MNVMKLVQIVLLNSQVECTPSEKPLSSSRKVQVPSETETRVVQRLDATSHEYLRKLGQIHDMQLELRCPGRAVHSGVQRDMVASMARITTDSRVILDIFRKSEEVNKETEGQLHRTVMKKNRERVSRKKESKRPSWR